MSVGRCRRLWPVNPIYVEAADRLGCEVTLRLRAGARGRLPTDRNRKVFGVTTPEVKNRGTRLLLLIPVSTVALDHSRCIVSSADGRRSKQFLASSCDLGIQTILQNLAFNANEDTRSTYYQRPRSQEIWPTARFEWTRYESRRASTGEVRAAR